MRSSEIFLTEEKLEELLDRLGLTVVFDTSTDIACYCPFHDNRDSPAFNISKTSPHLWKCWNGKCGQKGNILTLLLKKGYSPNEAKRMLLEGVVNADEFVDLIRHLLKEEQEDYNEWARIDPKVFRQEDQDNGYPAKQYLCGRGIGEEAYDYFRMGYSHKKRMAVIPVFTERSELAGIIGRTIEGKRYQYSSGLNRSGIVWGLNFAVGQGNDLILTEGALDAVYVWQSGYRCVAAILGSAISANQWKLIRSNFGSITLFFDNDEAGNALRDSILETERELTVSTVKYPRDVKDPGELTQDEISNMVLSRTTGLENMFTKWYN